MRLPILTEYATAKDNIEEFKGVNHNLRTEPGQWYNQKNMTTDYYPVASPREKRSVQQLSEEIKIPIDFATPQGVLTIAPDIKGLCYSDKKLYLLRPINEGDTSKGYWFFNDDKPICIDKFRFSITYYEPIKAIKTEAETYKLVQFSAVFSAGANIKVGDKLNLKIITRTEEEIIYSNIEVTGADSLYFICKFPVEATFDYVIDKMYVINITHKNRVLSHSLLYGTNDKYREVIRMGSYICAFPDGVIYESANSSSAIPIFKVNTSNFSYNFAIETVIPDDTNNWASIERYDGTHYRVEDGAVQEYLEKNETWVTKPTYLKISVLNDNHLFDDFNVGDAINISSVGNSSQLDGDIKGSLVIKQTSAYENPSAYRIIEKGQSVINDPYDSYDPHSVDYIIVSGYIQYKKSTGQDTYDDRSGIFLFDNRTSGTEITIKRKMPDIKYACESQNRIWGCSSDGHEIYASSLGNPYSYYDFSGLSTDSYAVNVGTDGEFTACVNYLGRPLFFKENALHIISGSYPTNLGTIDGGSYAVETITQFKGVEKGSEKSLAIIDNILYYKSAAGIVAFDGSNTVVISDVLGKEKYKNAVAGAYKNKYYVSMQDKSGNWQMFVYDTALGTWCKEDNTHVLDTINVNNELLYLTASNNINSVTKDDVLEYSDYEIEDDFEWECETGNFGYSYPNNKYLSRYQIRMQIADGAKAAFFIQYNSDGVWHRKGEMTGRGLKTHLLPIIPVRCDHMKIKIKGKGDVKIYSIAKIFEEGGDV